MPLCPVSKFNAFPCHIPAQNSSLQICPTKENIQSFSPIPSESSYKCFELLSLTPPLQRKPLQDPITYLLASCLIWPTVLLFLERNVWQMYIVFHTFREVSAHKYVHNHYFNYCSIARVNVCWWALTTGKLRIYQTKTNSGSPNCIILFCFLIQLSLFSFLWAQSCPTYQQWCNFNAASR